MKVITVVFVVYFGGDMRARQITAVLNLYLPQHLVIDYNGSLNDTIKKRNRRVLVKSAKLYEYYHSNGLWPKVVNFIGLFELTDSPNIVDTVTIQESANPDLFKLLRERPEVNTLSDFSNYLFITTCLYETVGTNFYKLSRDSILALPLAEPTMDEKTHESAAQNTESNETVCSVPEEDTNEDNSSPATYYW